MCMVRKCELLSTVSLLLMYYRHPATELSAVVKTTRLEDLTVSTGNTEGNGAKRQGNGTRREG